MDDPTARRAAAQAIVDAHRDKLQRKQRGLPVPKIAHITPQAEKEADSESWVTLHEIFVRERKAQGVTQEQLASKIGMAQSSLAAVESGASIPINKIVPICEALGLVRMPEVHLALARRIQREMFGGVNTPENVVEAVKTLLRYRKRQVVPAKTPPK